jgi:hypothetical protein
MWYNASMPYTDHSSPVKGTRDRKLATPPRGEQVPEEVCANVTLQHPSARYPKGNIARMHSRTRRLRTRLTLVGTPLRKTRQLTNVPDANSENHRLFHYDKPNYGLEHPLIYLHVP